MNEYTVEEREELLDTLNAKDDTLRIVYRINTGDGGKFEHELYDICEYLIADEKNVDYKAIAFFFWKEGMAIGEEAAIASLTYAPGGDWERSFDANRTCLPPMRLGVDFNRYAE